MSAEILLHRLMQSVDYQGMPVAGTDRVEVQLPAKYLREVRSYLDESNARQILITELWNAIDDLPIPPSCGPCKPFVDRLVSNGDFDRAGHTLSRLELTPSHGAVENVTQRPSEPRPNQPEPQAQHGDKTMTTATPTYRKTILVDGKQVPAHLLWTDEGHHNRPESLHTWRMIDGRYRHETDEGTITTSERPKSGHGTYLPTRVVVVRVPAGNAAIGSLWRSHLGAPSAADRDVLTSLADSEDARWIKLASKIKMVHEDRISHVGNSIGSGMTIRLELSI